MKRDLSGTDLFGMVFVKIVFWIQDRPYQDIFLTTRLSVSERGFWEQDRRSFLVSRTVWKGEGGMFSKASLLTKNVWGRKICG